MTNIAEYVAQLAEDLNKSDQCRAIKTKLIHSHLLDQPKALEEAIQQLRGEVTSEDRDCLGLINSWQLIQVLCAGATGHLPDLDTAIFKSPVKGFRLRDAKLTPEADRWLRDTFTPEGLDSQLLHLANQFRRSFLPAEQRFLITASKPVVERTLGLPAGMTVVDLIQYGISVGPSIAETFEENLAGMHEHMMESRSASKSLLQQPPLKESRYFHQIDGRTADHPDHPFNRTAQGIIYPKQVASSPQEELMMHTLDQAHEGYLKDFRRMVEKGWGAIRGENCLVVRRLEVLDPLRLLQVLQQGPVVIVGGQDLEFMIRDSSTLRHLLVEDEKRYSNRPMGRINGTLITISSEIPEGGEGKFLYAISELRERIR